MIARLFADSPVNSVSARLRSGVALLLTGLNIGKFGKL